MKKLTRRTLLKSAPAAAAGAILTACAPAQVATPAAPALPAASSTPAASTATVAVIATEPPPPESTATRPAEAGGKVYYRPEIIKFHPDQKSRVVRGSSAAVWDGDTLVPAAVRKLVDTSITALTGLSDPKAAWQGLFRPTERIAIKVNVFRNSKIWTHPALVQAVTDSLVEAGIPPEQITIFDYYTTELTDGGFTVNKDGPGVRCYGTDESYATKINLDGSIFNLSDILAECDALINMPVLKSHMIAGLTFALKNHYGSVSDPGGLHNMRVFLPALNAIPQIRETTRLVIGDVLEANTKYTYAFPYWQADYKGDSILMAYDPLAHDAVGMDMLVKLATEKGNSTENLIGMADPWFKNANAAGIGTADKDKIELVEVKA